MEGPRGQGQVYHFLEAAKTLAMNIFVGALRSLPCILPLLNKAALPGATQGGLRGFCIARVSL